MGADVLTNAEKDDIFVALSESYDDLIAAIEDLIADRLNLTDPVLGRSPRTAVMAMLRDHDGMDPSGVTCLGCGANLGEPSGLWADAAALLHRHQWEIVLTTAAPTPTPHADEAQERGRHE